MDVRCGRCGTEYDFDDALISGRGTTVKCTQCGHQFKVFPEGGGRSPERWRVQTLSAITPGELEFTSLKELQRAIGRGDVNPEDRLSRGSEAPRPLASIAELEPFFAERGASPATQAPRHVSGSAPGKGLSSTRLGLPSGEPGLAPSAMQPPRTTPGMHSGPPPTEAVPAKRRTSTTIGLPAPAGIPPLQDIGPATQASEPRGSAMNGRQAGPDTLRKEMSRTLPSTAVSDERGPASPKPKSAPGQAGGPPIVSVLSAPPPGKSAPPRLPGPSGTQPSLLVPEQLRGPSPPQMKGPPPLAKTVRSATSSRVREVTAQPVSGATTTVSTRPDQSRERLEHQPKPSSVETPAAAAAAAAPETPARRGGAPRWILAVVLLGTAAFVSLTVGRNYLQRASGPAPEPSSAVTDARIEPLLARADELHAQGDLEGAKEQLTKASALAPSAPEVRAALARLEVTRTDLEWLRLRLLSPDDAGHIDQVRRTLSRRLQKAEAEVKAAEEVAPDDVRVRRARVHLARLGGDVAEARRRLAGLDAEASDPDMDYLLAALDLAEASPSWPPVLERLRAAASTEKPLSGARTALIYALVRSGDLAGAKDELAKLQAGATDQVSPPLLTDARLFVERNAGEAGDKASPKESVASAADNPSPESAASPPANSYQAELRAGHGEAQRGNLAQAEAHFRAALKHRPEDAEALAGLAEVASRRGDSAQAAELYQRVLAKNPSYLPALVARADQLWASGDRAGALKLYRRVVDQAGGSSYYAQRARARIVQAEREQQEIREAAPKTDTTPSQPSEPREAPKNEKQGSSKIDTTDLPEYNE